MATKEISQLTSTNVSNDTDLLMTRQGSQDKAVQVEKVRNIGTEAGNSLGVGGYGIGANAILITDIFSDDNVDLVQRDGLYRITLSTANKPTGVGIGEMLHIQTSNNDATQKLWGDNSKEYFRRKISGTWQTWVLVGALDKAAMRTDLSVYSKAEGDARYLNESSLLGEIAAAGSASQLQAINNLIVFSEETLTLGGDIDAIEKIKCSRVGSQVTISSIFDLSHVSSSSPSSTSGIIPSTYRPPASVSNAFFCGSVNGMVFVDNFGNFTLLYRDNTGAPISQTGTTYAVSINYTVN